MSMLASRPFCAAANSDSFKVTTPSDQEIRMTRLFNAPRQLVFDAMTCTAPGAVVCLTGVSSGGRTIGVDAGAINRELVLDNDVVFGSVNANRTHYEMAAAALARADRGWLNRLITRRVPLDHWREAYERRADDVKVIVDFTAAA